MPWNISFPHLTLQLPWCWFGRYDARMDAFRVARRPSRFLAFADLVFGIEPVDETEEAVEDAVTAAIDELQAFFAELGMPTKLGEFGSEARKRDAFLATLKANKGEAFGGFKKITLEDARAIYESAF